MYQNTRSLFNRSNQLSAQNTQNSQQYGQRYPQTFNQGRYPVAPNQQGEKPVLAVITADTCGGCVMFKQRVWPQLKKKIQDSNKVKLVEINLPSLRDRIPQQYPEGLQKWVGWYPTLGLFTADSWNSGGNLVGSVFNGTFEGDKIKMLPQDQGRPMTVNDISDWIDRELAGPTFTRGPVMRQPVRRLDYLPSTESESYSGSTSTSTYPTSRSRSVSSSTIRETKPRFRGIVYNSANMNNH